MSNIICVCEDFINFVKIILGNTGKVISRVVLSETLLKAQVYLSR